jgi:hypothetical protein
MSRGSDTLWDRIKGSAALVAFAVLWAWDRLVDWFRGRGS